jgi:hypothetical protein
MPGLDPLEKEATISQIEPIGKETSEKMMKILNRLINRGNLSRAEQKAFGFWKAQLAVENLKGAVQQEFMRDFWAWLLGRGKESDHEKTPWYRQSLTNDLEVSIYCDTFVKKRADFQIKLQLLRMRHPIGINQTFLYYKYVIRGEEPDATHFLDDWHLFQEEFVTARAEGQAERNMEAIEGPYDGQFNAHEMAPYGGGKKREVGEKLHSNYSAKLVQKVTSEFKSDDLSDDEAEQKTKEEQNLVRTKRPPTLKEKRNDEPDTEYPLDDSDVDEVEALPDRDPDPEPPAPSSGPQPAPKPVPKQTPPSNPDDLDPFGHVMPKEGEALDVQKFLRDKLKLNMVHYDDYFTDPYGLRQDEGKDDKGKEDMYADMPDLAAMEERFETLEKYLQPNERTQTQTGLRNIDRAEQNVKKLGEYVKQLSEEIKKQQSKHDDALKAQQGKIEDRQRIAELERLRVSLQNEMERERAARQAQEDRLRNQVHQMEDRLRDILRGMQNNAAVAPAAQPQQPVIINQHFGANVAPPAPAPAPAAAPVAAPVPAPVPAQAAPPPAAAQAAPPPPNNPPPAQYADYVQPPYAPPPQPQQAPVQVTINNPSPPPAAAPAPAPAPQNPPPAPPAAAVQPIIVQMPAPQIIQQAAAPVAPAPIAALEQQTAALQQQLNQTNQTLAGMSAQLQAVRESQSAEQRVLLQEMAGQIRAMNEAIRANGQQRIAAQPLPAGVDMTMFTNMLEASSARTRAEIMELLSKHNFNSSPALQEMAQNNVRRDEIGAMQRQLDQVRMDMTRLNEARSQPADYGPVIANLQQALAGSANASDIVRLTESIRQLQQTMEISRVANTNGNNLQQNVQTMMTINTETLLALQSSVTRQVDKINELQRAYTNEIGKVAGQQQIIDQLAATIEGLQNANNPADVEKIKGLQENLDLLRPKLGEYARNAKELEDRLNSQREQHREEVRELNKEIAKTKKRAEKTLSELKKTAGKKIRDISSEEGRKILRDFTDALKKRQNESDESYARTKKEVANWKKQKELEKEPEAPAVPEKSSDSSSSDSSSSDSSSSDSSSSSSSDSSGLSEEERRQQALDDKNAVYGPAPGFEKSKMKPQNVPVATAEDVIPIPPVDRATTVQPSKIDEVQSSAAEVQVGKPLPPVPPNSEQSEKSSSKSPPPQRPNSEASDNDKIEGPKQKDDSGDTVDEPKKKKVAKSNDSGSTAEQKKKKVQKSDSGSTGEQKRDNLSKNKRSEVSESHAEESHAEAVAADAVSNSAPAPEKKKSKVKNPDAPKELQGYSQQQVDSAREKREEQGRKDAEELRKKAEAVAQNEEWQESLRKTKARKEAARKEAARQAELKRKQEDDEEEDEEKRQKENLEGTGQEDMVADDDEFKLDPATAIVDDMTTLYEQYVYGDTIEDRATALQELKDFASSVGIELKGIPKNPEKFTPKQQAEALKKFMKQLDKKKQMFN